MLTGANAIVDISHHNGKPDLRKAKASGIVGVIQKATQGTTFKDPTFGENRKKASDAGLLFGAYHFGVGGAGVDQATFFLDVVRPIESDLLVLDFEGNPEGPSMTLEEARAFVTDVQAATTRWPGLYSGHYLKRIDSSDYRSGACQLLAMDRAVRPQGGDSACLEEVDDVAIHRWQERSRATHRGRDRRM